MYNIMKFWNTQPHTLNNNKGTILTYNKLSELYSFLNKQIQLPNNYYWYELDKNNEKDVNDFFYFLKEQYSSNTKFSLLYTKDFLQWILNMPNSKKEYHLLVKTNDKIVASIIGIPISITVENDILNSISITLLCIHKLLRNKNLAPVLIKEISRRAYNNNIIYGIYMNDFKNDNIITNTTYYHRSLDIQKLLDIGFEKIPSHFYKFKNPIEMMKKLNRLPTNYEKNFREMNIIDIDNVYNLYYNYAKKFKIYPNFSKNDFKYLFCNNHIVKSFVIEDNGLITDFGSFYISSITSNNIVYNTAYFYYYAGQNKQLFMENLLLAAKNYNCIVFNILDTYDMKDIFNNLKFYEGTLQINYYFYNYNYNCEKKNVGIVIL